MNQLEKIRQCFKNDTVFYTRHAKIEMETEEFGQIFEHEVYEAISTGETIEDYPNDKPYPSALVFGRSESNRPLHIVCAYDADQNLTIVVTVYQPDPQYWINFKKRKKI